MKTLLIRVPTIIDVSASTAPICPPIGLAYLRAVVKQFADDIVVIDAVGNAPLVRKVDDDRGRSVKLLGQTAAEIVEATAADINVVLVSIMFSQDWPYAKTILRALREKLPNALIVAGGEHITALPEVSMEQAPEIDICVLGEGELTLANVLSEYQEHGTVPTAVPGTYAGADAQQMSLGQSRRKRIKNLDTIARPDWDGFPLDNYFAGGHGFGVTRAGIRTMPIIASRGCPFECTFCSNKFMWGQYWKARTPGDVIDEMKLYIEKYGIGNFDFYDLTAIVKKSWIVEFCNLLIQNDLNITWQLPSGTRSEAIDREVCALLYKSGCRNLSYAPESGSPDVLAMIKKKVNLDAMLTSMAGCVEEGLSVKANIICGFPDEQLRHLRESLTFIIRMAWVGIDDMSINQFSPYPGSPLFNDLVAREKLALDDDYFVRLSYYSSMTNAHSYSDHLSSRQLLVFKIAGTMAFYIVSFLRRPLRILRVMRNVWRDVETTRLEKTLLSFKSRFFRFGAAAKP